MSQKSTRRAICKRKRARRIMRRRRCGRISPTTNRATFGPSAQSCTKWSPWIHPSLQETWRASTKGLSRVSIQNCPPFIQVICPPWSSLFWRLTPKRGQTPNKFSTCPSLLPNTTSIKMIRAGSLVRRPPDCWALSKYLATFLSFLNACQPPNTKAPK